MKMSRIRLNVSILLAFLLVFGALGSTLSYAADYPKKPIQIIVPFSPGGGADTSQRTFNKYAAPLVGKSLIIVTKPGAGGTTGWAELVRAKPDGYTMAIVTPPFNVIPPLVRPKQTGYTLDQFTNICIYAMVGDMLYTREGSQFKTLEDVISYAKKNPKKIKMANTGTLGADFMTTLLIEDATGIKFTQIPFTGGARSLQATLAGTTDVMVGSSVFAASQKGKLRPLAIATDKRDPLFPDVPTFKEKGYNVVSERYRAFAGPPGLPKNIVDFWANIGKKVSENPNFQKDMKKIGQPPAFRGPKDAARLINRMTGRMQGMVDKYKLAK
jgi:tripartite-type tricarboxylate transporter receptor subunit TctC